MIFFITLVVGYALVTLGAYAGQRRLVYPYRGVGEVPVVAGATLQKLAGADGRMVHALYARAREGEPTLVHFHGNGEELADLEEFTALFRNRGIGVLAVEYPGYGLSKAGSPSEQAIYEDAETALRDLRENQGISRENIVLSGQSLGTGVAVEMARRSHGARVVLYSPYTSIVDVASAIEVPVLVVHGTNDEVIPFALGKELAALFPNARLVSLNEGRHNDLFVRGGAPLVDSVAAFCRGE